MVLLSLLESVRRVGHEISEGGRVALLPFPQLLDAFYLIAITFYHSLEFSSHFLISHSENFDILVLREKFAMRSARRSRRLNFCSWLMWFEMLHFLFKMVSASGKGNR
jgi:hypothetical protein